MKRIKAVFFDIDGTLVSFRTHCVPPSTVKALDALRANGIKVFVATGRMLPMINVLDGIPFDGYITCNGAYCVNTKRELFYACPIPEQDLQALAFHLEKDPFPVAYMSDDEITINYVDSTVTSMAQHINVPPPRVLEPLAAAQKNIYQLCAYVDDDKVRHLVRNVLVHCASNRWTPVFADINVRGINKQTGIDKLLAYENIGLNETMAFGDGGNDIPMLKHVTIGVGMGNASEEVKACADYVTDSVDDDGIYNALKHFGLLD
ncbi:MAG: Cof-type HAD-IIB family hydrolase [Tannerella sp.]|jgi:Cof subfamily protein (haloacid dehalogenase superfamily)|nr:Cof-type HAD-IIB family hydrolase [Tannerella sp.]